MSLSLRKTAGSTLTSSCLKKRRSASQLSGSIGVRFVHNTNKQDHTTLFNTSNDKYSKMSLKHLKIECKNRGLKVSGKKSDLISRISAFESSSITNNQRSYSLSHHTTTAATTVFTNNKINNNSFISKRPNSSTKVHPTQQNIKSINCDNETVNSNHINGNRHPTLKDYNRVTVRNNLKSTNKKINASKLHNKKDINNKNTNTITDIINNTNKNISSKHIKLTGKGVDSVEFPNILSLEANLHKNEDKHILYMIPLTKEASMKKVTPFEKRANNSVTASKNVTQTLITPDIEGVKVFTAEQEETTSLPKVKQELSTISYKGKFINEKREDADNDYKNDNFSASCKELEPRDKRFFLGVLTSVVAWWGLKWFEDENKTKN
ncbi:Aim34p SCDLUD_000928 [Saccharomycodes ludwigii]|uniref:Aim34p n=1 Tax=Saccharomycodes ludwigii TaxID=36035 RepID=UPI001E863F10|nr:hypothetical protein SCDLUD_000928 [Saccharomycodes ludwigii]KAH3903303.1 hypothetical protein SCDLUD_000928 [Saccharomycodes ludwigii]